MRWNAKIINLTILEVQGYVVLSIFQSHLHVIAHYDKVKLTTFQVIVRLRKLIIM